MFCYSCLHLKLLSSLYDYHISCYFSISFYFVRITLLYYTITPTKQHNTFTCTWVHPLNVILGVITQCIRGARVASKVETSVITWHKRQDRNLNIYLRPNSNLQLFHCLCLAVSLYSALQTVVLRLKITQNGEGILVQAWVGPGVSRSYRHPDFNTFDILTW